MDSEYLKAGPLRRRLLGIVRWVRGVPTAVRRFFRSVPSRLRRLWSGFAGFFEEIWQILRNGDPATKASFFIMGFGCIRRGRIVKGLIYAALQLAFWLFFFSFGLYYIGRLPTLGTVLQHEIWNEEKMVYEYVSGDNSMLILLYGVVSIAVTVVYLSLYFSSIRECAETERLARYGKRVPTFRSDVRGLLDRDFHRVMLSLPALAVIVFTVLPIIFMVCLAFTNYDRMHMPPGNLFTWVGIENFKAIFGLTGSSLLSSTFGKILGWTLVWATLATLSNYILGMLLAIMINRRGIRFKRVFRTLFVLTVAVPQFVSLMFMRNVFADDGLFNVFLQYIGLSPVRFLTDGSIARVMVIVINMWVGIPYSMLITTGILMNIPNDLYESCRIDGASPARQFFRITLPYVLFVTTPYLITQFVGNINNFNVIWLLTGGGPITAEMYQSGRTDLLITWLYRLTTGEQNYKLASVIGIITFVICAVFSLIIYNRSGSAKNEGDFA